MIGVFCNTLLFLLFLIVIIVPAIWALLPIVIIREWEGGIILRLGKFNKKLKKGINIIIPLVDRIIKVDKRIETIDVPRQEVITADNIPMKIDGVIYFKIIDSSKAILNVEDYFSAIGLFAQTAIRDIIGGAKLDTILEDREGIAKDTKDVVANDMLKWGIEVVSINIQHIELPDNMKRAMARQAEAEREKRSIIIKAQGELEASKNFKKASENLATDSAAVNLRTLAFISEISADSNAEFSFLIPLDNMDVLKMSKKKR